MNGWFNLQKVVTHRLRNSTLYYSSHFLLTGEREREGPGVTPGGTKQAWRQREEKDRLC